MKDIKNLLLTKEEIALIITALKSSKEETTRVKTFVVQDNNNHREMIAMLDKDENNKLAKERLKHEIVNLEKNEEQLKCFSDFESQLELLIEKIISQLKK